MLAEILRAPQTPENHEEGIAAATRIHLAAQLRRNVRLGCATGAVECRVRRMTESSDDRAFAMPGKVILLCSTGSHFLRPCGRGCL